MGKKWRLFPGSVLSLCLLVSLWSGLCNSYIYVEAEGMVQVKSDLGDRFLKADGKVLRDHSGTGEVVTLRGTNIGGWQVMEGWMCPTNAPDQKTAIATLTERFGKETAEELIKTYEYFWWQEQDFDNTKELNFNVLRLPISYLNLLDEEGKLREDTLDTYDWFVDECEKRDIYVILDLHSAPGSQNGRDHSGDKSGSVLYTDEKAQELTVSLWEQLAEHFKGNPTIAGYDLLNEPEGNEVERAPWGKLQLPFYDRMYQAIRKIDPDHIIIFNAVWEPTNMPKPSEYGWENVIYEYHYYGWDGTDNPVSQRNFINEKVQKDAQTDFGVPVLVGEFTLFDKLQSWEYALETFEEEGWSWTTWTYKTVDCGNWGIYNSTTSTTPKANIYLDSAELIKDKWSKTATSTSFKMNKYLHDLLKSFAGGKASDKSSVWFQNFEFNEAELRAGTDATGMLVNAKEATYTMDNESKAVKLLVTETERIPTETSRNVCIPPAIRNSVDASGFDYLIFDAYVSKAKQALQVTLVDKAGNTWSKFTAADAMPIGNGWEKLFVDISKADIDISSIIEVRIGANHPGEYYFDHIYFAHSYADPLPVETELEMKQDLGDAGVVTDWEDVQDSDTAKMKAKEKVLLKTIITLGGIVILFVTGLVGLRYLKKSKGASK